MAEKSSCSYKPDLIHIYSEYVSLMLMSPAPKQVMHNFESYTQIQLSFLPLCWSCSPGQTQMKVQDNGSLELGQHNMRGKSHLVLCQMLGRSPGYRSLFVLWTPWGIWWAYRKLDKMNLWPDPAGLFVFSYVAFKNRRLSGWLVT